MHQQFIDSFAPLKTQHLARSENILTEKMDMETFEFSIAKILVVSVKGVGANRGTIDLSKPAVELKNTNKNKKRNDHEKMNLFFKVNSIRFLLDWKKTGVNQ